jgi:hypothetical protein
MSASRHESVILTRLVKRRIGEILPTLTPIPPTEEKLDAICSKYVSHMAEKAPHEIRAELKAVNQIREVYQNLLTLDLLDVSAYRNETTDHLSRMSRKIETLREHLDTRVRDLADMRKVLAIVCASSSSTVFFGGSLHPRGLLIGLHAICLRHLLEMIPGDDPNRTNIDALQQTVSRQLYRFVSTRPSDFMAYGSTDDDRDICARVTGGVTSVYQFAWYHTDISPYILSLDSVRRQKDAVYDLVASLTEMLNSDHGGTDATDTNTFIEKGARRMANALALHGGVVRKKTRCQ